jgi:TusA-related sulfurtransferase
MSGSSPRATLDLRGTPCPLNYVRARLALESLPLGGVLQLDLDPGEPEVSVTESLRGEGHQVTRADPSPAADQASVRLLIRRGG